MFRIIQISDPHVSARHDHFAGNVEAVRRGVIAAAPDLVVDTGDLSMDGAARPEDLAAAAAWHRDLGLPWIAVPGNHDVGDVPRLRPDQPVTDARLAAWRDIVGPDRWFVDREAWRLVGLDAMLLGTGHPEEEAQFLWLAQALDTARPILIFLHKPPLIDDPDEGARGYWNVEPEARRRLLAVLEGRDVRLVASGHLHVQRRFRAGGLDYLWAPSAAFVVGALQEELGGERRIGLVEHVIEGERIESRFLRPEGVEDLSIDPVIRAIYPPDAVAASVAR